MRITGLTRANRLVDEIGFRFDEWREGRRQTSAQGVQLRTSPIAPVDVDLELDGLANLTRPAASITYRGRCPHREHGQCDACVDERLDLRNDLSRGDLD